MEAERIIHLISRLRDRNVRALQAELDREGLGDLLPAHAGLIYALHRSGPLPMGGLAELLERDNSTVTQLAARLVEAGYITRRRSDQDRRAWILELSPRGRRAAPAVRRASRRVLRRMYADIPDQERDRLMHLLIQVYHNLG